MIDVAGSLDDFCCIGNRIDVVVNGVVPLGALLIKLKGVLSILIILQTFPIILTLFEDAGVSMLENLLVITVYR